MSGALKTANGAKAGASAASVPVTVTLAEGGSREWRLAEEVPVNLAYNGRPHVVMMATPEDLEDFALGFSLSEGVLASPDLVRGIEVRPVEGGIMVEVATAARAEVARERQARSLEGRSGCGLCGMQRLDQVVRNVRTVKGAGPIAPAAIARALQALPDRQLMNRVNHSVHAAAWAESDGTITLVREDVGRHNALDKLIGALARSGADTTRGFCVMTSRCSFELVQKCAAVGIPCLVTVSAPTSLALDLARRSGMVLASASPDGVVMFATT